MTRPVTTHRYDEAREIFEQIEDTRERYMPDLRADMLRMALPEGRAIGSQSGRISTRAS